jgi:hypothetical protein
LGEGRGRRLSQAQAELAALQARLLEWLRRAAVWVRSRVVLVALPLPVGLLRAQDQQAVSPLPLEQRRLSRPWRKPLN